MLGAEGVPAVDDEEDVAEHVAAARAGRELAAAAPGPQVGHRLDPGLAEPALPPGEQRGHLGHGAPHELGLAAPRDRADVRQPRQPGERAAAEVHGVELHLGRRVGQRGRGDERAQQRRLARLRPAGDHHVPRRPGELGPQHVAALVVGAVDDADRHRELPVGGEAGRGEAAVRGGGQGRQQRVERGRVGQRRQPHLVRGRALAAQPFDDDVEHRRRPRPARHRRPVRPDHRGRPAGRGVAVPLEHGARLHPARGEGARAHLAGHRGGVGGGPLGGAVRRRHVPGLEPGHRRRLDLEVARARDRRQLRRVRDPEHGPRVRRRERLEPDAVGQVRVEAAQPSLLEALRGEQQVHLQRAAQPPDRDEQLREVGLLAQQLGELVDDDEQGRQRLQRRAVLPGALVLGDVGEVARRAQHLLAALHLARQRVLHAVDEAEVVGEVGDHRGDVRRAGEPGERGAALEVDEHEVERLGRVRRDQPEHQGPQQLGLARPGGPDAQPVRAHPLLGGLLDVELHRLAARPRPRTAPAAGRAPGAGARPR